MVFLNEEKYLEEIVDKYSNMIYRLAMTRTGSKENSEDVLQEVMLKLAKKLPQFENEDHEKAWLIRVTINCSNTLLSSSFLKHKAELDENLSFETQERHDIYYAVLELSLKYRTIIHLYYYEGYKINEISNIMKTNENTIKSQLSRAREQLKLKMKGGIDDEE